MGIKLTVNLDKGIEACVNLDFTSGWSKSNPEDVCALCSRSGYIVYFSGTQLCWSRKLQSRIALSSAEAECIALSKCLQDVIPVMNLLKEIANTV